MGLLCLNYIKVIIKFLIEQVYSNTNPFPPFTQECIIYLFKILIVLHLNYSNMLITSKKSSHSIPTGCEMASSLIQDSGLNK